MWHCVSTTLEFKKKRNYEKKGTAQINGKLQMGEKKKKKEGVLERRNWFWT